MKSVAPTGRRKIPRQKYPVQTKIFRTLLSLRRRSGAPPYSPTGTMQGLRPMASPGRGLLSMPA